MLKLLIPVFHNALINEDKCKENMKTIFRKVLAKEEEPKVLMKMLFVIYEDNRKGIAFYTWRDNKAGTKSFYTTNMDSSWVAVNPKYWLEEIPIP